MTSIMRPAGLASTVITVSSSISSYPYCRRSAVALILTLTLTLIPT